MLRIYVSFAFLLLLSFNCANKKTTVNKKTMDSSKIQTNHDTATLGAGCFWCVEAIFSELKGVDKVLPGYCGGHTKNPDYKDVCTGTTGHAEVCQIHFDPEIISFAQILEVFWTTHDPTTLNRQGNDVGTQYRSAIFYNSEEQKRIAEESKSIVATKIWDNKIVTEIVPLTDFYEAEDYHHDYFENNPDQGYCRIVIEPKVLKFRKLFKEKLKQND
ncbi:MAG: peptide-methionine (S)-S-oxide reductase MsrA [Saprospiraceae bacterium]|nr:peptide-methionine (S)-S-oxide reductase MsrA [Saprospiraceae bacterium]